MGKKGKECQEDGYELADLRAAMKKALNPRRYEHTLGVAYMAAALAMRYGEDVKKAQTAGLLHDCAKNLSNEKRMKICQKNGISVSEAERRNPFLLHAKVGSFLAKEKYGIRDQEILDAIACHTTGKPGMGMLDKILYIADYIEPCRSQAPDLAAVRRLAFEDLDQCLYRILMDTLEYLEASRTECDILTRETYEYYREHLNGEST